MAGEQMKINTKKKINRVIRHKVRDQTQCYDSKFSVFKRNNTEYEDMCLLALILSHKWREHVENGSILELKWKRKRKWYIRHEDDSNVTLFSSKLALLQQIKILNGFTYFNSSFMSTIITTTTTNAIWKSLKSQFF